MSVKVLRTRLENLDEWKKKGDRKFDTQDYVFVESCDDIEKIEPKEKIGNVSDFAITQGCYINRKPFAPKGKDGGSYWLRDASVGYECEYNTERYFPYRVSRFSALYKEKVGRTNAHSTCVGVRPCLAIDIRSLISEQCNLQGVKVEEIKKGGEILYRTIEIPDFQYPQSKISDEESKKLEKAYNSKKLKKTGKSYTGRDISNEQNEGSKTYDEYSYEDSLFIRVDANPKLLNNKYPDGTKTSQNETVWIRVEPNENGLTIQITPENGEIVEIELDKHNQITGYRNPNVEEIGDFFLFINNSLKSLDLPNVKQIGGECLFFNNLLTGLNLPNVYVEFFGENFWQCNRSLTKLNLPNVEQIGDNFLQNNESLKSLDLLNVKHVGDNFLLHNKILESINLPNIKQIGNSFLRHNNSLKSLDLPNVKWIGYCFLQDNEPLTKLDLPNVEQIGHCFLRDNKSLKNLDLPKVKRIGNRSLLHNKSLNLNIPNIERTENGCFLTSLKDTANFLEREI